jgi:hypothetical protein
MRLAAVWDFSWEGAEVGFDCHTSAEPTRASPALRRRRKPIARADDRHCGPGLARGRGNVAVVQDARDLAG